MLARRLAASFWTLGLLIACLLPAAWLSVEESRYQVGITHVDKLVHCGLFAGFAFLWLRTVQSRSGQAAALIVGVALALLTELGQDLPMIGRDCDPFDGLADVVGLLLGSLGYSILRVARRCPNERLADEAWSVHPG